MLGARDWRRFELFIMGQVQERRYSDSPATRADGRHDDVSINIIAVRIGAVVDEQRGMIEGCPLEFHPVVGEGEQEVHQIRLLLLGQFQGPDVRVGKLAGEVPAPVVEVDDIAQCGG